MSVTSICKFRGLQCQVVQCYRVRLSRFSGGASEGATEWEISRLVESSCSKAEGDRSDAPARRETRQTSASAWCD